MSFMPEFKTEVGILDKLVGENGDLRDPKRNLYLAPIVYRPHNVFYGPYKSTSSLPRCLEEVSITVAPQKTIEPQDIERLQILLTKGLTDLAPHRVRNFDARQLDFYTRPTDSGSYLWFGHLEFLEDIGPLELIGRLKLDDPSLAARMRDRNLPQGAKRIMEIPTFRSIRVQLFSSIGMANAYANYLNRVGILEPKQDIIEVLAQINAEWAVPLRQVLNYHHLEVPSSP